MKRILLALGLAVSACGAAQRNIVIDTDVGSDDLMAIAFLLSRPDVNIEAITVVNGIAHVDAGARNVLRLLELAGRTDIPVYAGRSTPLAGSSAFPDGWRMTSDALPGAALPRTERKARSEPAAEFLTHRLRAASKPFSILALGPLTNVAEALSTLPRGAYPVDDMVVMGGAVRVPGNLEPALSTDAEWNIYVDPTAARTVFESALRFRLVPLDACNRVPFDAAFLAEFRTQAKTPLARVVTDLLESSRTLMEEHIFYAWDPLAAVALVAPSVLKISSLPVEVANTGRTFENPNARTMVRVALDADASLFRKTFIDAFRNPKP